MPTGDGVADRADPRDVFTPRVTYLMYASYASLVFAAVVMARIGGHWEWALFGWGVAVGVAALFGHELLIKAMTAIFAVASAEFGRARSRLRARKRAIYPGFVACGIAAGVIAAGFASIWPDAAWTAIMVVSQLIVPAVMYPWVKRKLRSVST